MQALIDSFLNYCRNEKCLSKTTLIGYERYLQRFSNWCQNEGYKDLKQLTPPIIRQFLAIVRGPKGEHENTLVSIVYVLKSFGKYLQREFNINPFSATEVPKIVRKLPEILSKVEVKKLIESANTPLEKAVLEILYSSGLRASELCHLKCQDVNLDNRVLTVVNGKGGKSAIVPIGSHAITAIRGYIKSESISPDGFLFPMLKRSNLHRIVKQCAERAGITKNVYPHLLRHSFATHLLDGGADIMSVKEMLRHSSVTTTQVYTQVSLKNKLKACKKFWKMRESTPIEKPVYAPEVRKPNLRIGIKTPPKQYDTREKFIELLNRVRDYIKDKPLIRSLKGRLCGKGGNRINISDIIRRFDITYFRARRIVNMLVEERAGKKINIDSIFWQDDFIRAKIHEAIRLILSEGKKLYPQRKTPPKSQLHSYISMQELRDKINVGYGYMYKYIWPELKKDERLVELTWQEEVKAKEELDRLQRERYGSAKQGQRTDLKYDFCKFCGYENFIAVKTCSNCKKLCWHSGKSTSADSAEVWTTKKTSTILNEPERTTQTDIQLAKALKEYPELEKERFSIGITIHKTIDALISDMVKVLGIDEQTARDTMADLIRNKDKLTVAV